MTARRALFAQCLLVGLAMLASCASAARVTAPEARWAAPGARAAYPTALFAVISDPHVYDPSLGLSGEAFERATAGSRVLYGLSAELLHEAISEVLALKPAFLILPGDLTKDGEPSSHEIVLRELSRLSERGIDAYVIPGNHDIENPRAMRFADGKAAALEGVSVEGFSRLYASFGYGRALSRDPLSLSYVAQLVPGLRLLALDSFRYPELPDPKSPEPESLFPAETMAWIRSCLEDADREGERVIAMTHMSLLEHFAGQEKYFPESFPREI